MFIITNTTDIGEYTPSKTETFEEAQNFMYETTVNNYVAGVRDFSEFAKDTNTERCESYEELKQKNLLKTFLDWMSKDGTGSCYSEKSTTVVYADSTFNKMTIYNLDEI